MKIIGVTGGVGAGKSEILNALASDWKAVIVKADEVGHLVMEPSGSCYQPIIQLFGKDVVASDGKLDRAKIAACVFGNKELLEHLNAIVHPAVKAYIKNAIKQEQEKNTPIFVVEAALLIEDHYDEICDELWYIYADEATRAQRLQEHRGYSKEKIAGIFANQLSEAEFLAHCQFKIDNSGDFEDTKEQIKQRMQMYEIM